MNHANCQHYTVTTVPPVITSAPEDQTVELGGSAEFSCFATGIPDPTIAWLR